MLKLKLILVLLFISFLVKSQVYKAGTHFPYYYDINPDTIFTIGSGPAPGSHSFSQTYVYNIDSDSLPDFKIVASDAGGLGGASRSVAVIPLDTNCFVSFGRIDSLYHSYYNYWMTTPMAKPLHFGDSLNSISYTWKKTALFILNNSGSGPIYTHPTDWVSTNDLYVAIKYQSLADTMYGWVRVNCPSIQQCYLKDYSFSKCLGIPVLTVATSSSVTCASESVTINAGGASSYTWSTGSTGSSISVTPDTTTTYLIEGANMYGCSATAMITQSVVTCAGIREYDHYDIDLYPNPVVGTLYISDPENRFENAQLEISNYSGQPVLTQKHSPSIDVSGLCKGIYIIQIASKNKMYYSKFIKQ